MRKSAVKSVMLVIALVGATFGALGKSTPAAAASYELDAGHYLSFGGGGDGQDMDSGQYNENCGCYFGMELWMQSDGNVVDYAPRPFGSGLGRAIWASGTSNAYFLNMQTDGNLVTYDSNWLNGHSISNTSGIGNGAYLTLGEDGNLVVRDSGGTIRWSSGVQYGQDTASIDSGGTGNCMQSPYSSTQLCRNTWVSASNYMYFRAVDQYSSTQSEWTTPATGAVGAWNSAPGPQYYSYTAHSNDTWNYLVDAYSGESGTGLTGSVYAITWNCYASNGSCSDTIGSDGTVYYSNIYLNHSTLPTCSQPCTLSTANQDLVQNVVAHESGHAMLLGHNGLESGALMWPVGQASVTGPTSYDTGSYGTACGSGGFGVECVFGLG